MIFQRLPAGLRPLLPIDRDDVKHGLMYFYISSLLVALSVSFGASFIRPRSPAPTERYDLVESYCRYDGIHYADIATNGYSYTPGERSNVAFFPVYPSLAHLLHRSSGLDVNTSLLVVSNGALLALLILLTRYARTVHGNADAGPTTHTLAAFSFFPPAIFYHYAYSESVFALVLVAFLLAIRRGSPLWLVAALAGAASATRSVGIVLAPVAMAYILSRPAPLAMRFSRALLYSPLCVGGLAAYMTYQWVSFDDPLAFAKTQEHWRAYEPGSTADWITSLVTFEPVWGVFDPDSPRYWTRLDCHNDFAHSLVVVNSLTFVVFIATVVSALLTSTLTKYEIALSCMLLLFPYCLRGYDNSMLSMARFCSVVIPCYAVWGSFACRLPLSARLMYVVLATYYMAVFSMLFASNYCIF